MALIILQFVVYAVVAWAVAWAVFGNAEDGLFGDPKWRAENAGAWWMRYPPLVAVVWWRRNPFHNLFFHVFGVEIRSIWTIPKQDWASGHIWPAKDPGFVFALWNRFVPMFAFRSKKWEGYVGWRGSGQRGNLGAALRRRKTA